MERNIDGTDGAPKDSAGGSADSFGGTTGGFTTGEPGSGSSSTSGFGASGSNAGATADSDAASPSSGRAGARGKLGHAKQKAGELKATLADRLEAGAEKLRSRGQPGSYATESGMSGTADVSGDDPMAHVSDAVGRGLQGAADFLREGDLKESLEHQVKEHPARTLLIAAGVGYLLGKAFRR